MSVFVTCSTHNPCELGKSSEGAYIKWCANRLLDDLIEGAL